MPPSLSDSAPLNALAEQLREIADIVAGYGKRAAKASEQEGHNHVAALEQISRGFAEIAKELKALSASGNHSSEYRQIGRSLGAIADAVEGLSSRG